MLLRIAGACAWSFSALFKPAVTCQPPCQPPHPLPQILAANVDDVGPEVTEAVAQLEPAVRLAAVCSLAVKASWCVGRRFCCGASYCCPRFGLQPAAGERTLTSLPALPTSMCLPAVPAVLQGVPSVARAAAVTGIHDPVLFEVSVAGVVSQRVGRQGDDGALQMHWLLLQVAALQSAGHQACLKMLPRGNVAFQVPLLPDCLGVLPLEMQALAEAAVRAMPQLSAADICSVVESFSGERLLAVCVLGCHSRWVIQRPTRALNRGMALLPLRLLGASSCTVRQHLNTFLDPA